MLPERMTDSPLIRAAALVVAALLAGFGIGRLTAPSTVPDATRGSASARFSSATDQHSSTGRSESPPDAAAPLARNLAAKTGRGTDESPADPIARLRAVSEHGSQFGRIIKTLLVTSQLTPEQIPAVLAYAESAGGEEREVLMIGSLARWAELDAPAAAEWSRSHGGRAEMLEMSLAEWTARDPAAARAWVAGIENADQREGAFRGYLAGIAASDPAAALREAASLPAGDQSRRAHEMIFRTWAGRDPRAAASQALLLSDEKIRGSAVSAAVGIWGRKAPREALAFALQVSDKSQQRTLARQLLTDWAQTDSSAAMSQLMTLPAELRDEAAREVFRAAARRSLEDARRFAEQLPPGKAREHALGMIAVQWANRGDLRGALEYAGRMPSGQTRDESIGDIAFQWSQRDRPAATVWIAQQPEGAARVAASRQVMREWARADPAGAAQWIERLPAGATREAAAATYSEQVRNLDPAGAIAWAATVSDARQREQLAHEAFKVWRGRDSTAAKKWLQSTNIIGEDLRSVLLRAP